MRYIAIQRFCGETIAKIFDTYNEALRQIYAWFGADMLCSFEDAEENEDGFFTVPIEYIRSSFTNIDYFKSTDTFYYNNQNGSEYEIVPEYRDVL